MPNNLVFIVFHLTLGKLYTNSMLAMLNGRRKLRENLEGQMINTGTIIIAPQDETRDTGDIMLRSEVSFPDSSDTKVSADSLGRTSEDRMSLTLRLPALLTAAAFRYGSYNPGLTIRIILCVLSVPATGFVRSLASSWSAKRNAARLGAVLPPVVRGKWPGNLDTAVGLVKSMNRDYVMQYMNDLFEEYSTKTLNTRILWDDQIWTIDEGNVKFMLTGPGFEWFHKGYWWQERLESFLGNGIFNRDKEEWQAHRQIARPWFTRDRISDLGLFDRHAADTIDIMINHARDQRAFDAQDLLARFTLDSASEFLFGNCLHTLQKALPVAGKAKLGPKGSAIDDEFGTFAWAFEDTQVKIARRTRIGRMWPLFEMFGEAYADSNAIVHNWLKPLVEQALKEKDEAARLGRKDEDRTFLSHLADNVDDPESIRFQVLNMLLAGRDTVRAFFAHIYDIAQRRCRQRLH
ncbi:hypothetical protein EWM64_g6864 [Hericium alpestre]|uniref:Cytochrome P450 n=1 Tax=Hericium alpestre TaxID=135208 RepID=A0A4Y9ZUF9_9AGAM|nr:hypothetical protein EWM64_g6864 [Hericium alpestre]